MEFICRKYNKFGEIKSEINLDSEIDKYEGKIINRSEMARLYCYEYLTSLEDFKEDYYWICFKK